MSVVIVIVAWIVLIASAPIAWYCLSRAGAPDARETFPRGERR